uniref:NTP_transf_2 domain-containing protein n=1 Tax=Panagrellus redivivus TaxID=6233 RepID=A0A7E4UQM6_PANRE
MTQLLPLRRIDRDQLINEGADEHLFITPGAKKYFICYNAVNASLRRNSQSTSTFEMEAQMFASAPIDRAIVIAKQKIAKVIEKVLQSIDSTSITICYGSSVNGCSDNTSDLDLCWYLKKSQLAIRDRNFGREEIKTLLQTAHTKIKRLHPVDSCVFINAFVPIVKFCFVINGLRIDVDLSLNNMIGVFNTLLLKFYASIDKRFGQLARILKRWGINCGVINSMTMLNTYSVRLMIIHFLQCGTYPAILPNLNALYPHIVNGRLQVSIVKKYIEGSLRFPKVPMRRVNKLSLTRLIFGFMAYWECFDYENYCVSLMMARRQLKLHSEMSFFLEEVYNGENVARNINGQIVTILRNVFSRFLFPLFSSDYSFDNFINGRVLMFNGIPSHAKSVSYATPGYSYTVYNNGIGYYR